MENEPNVCTSSLPEPPSRILWEHFLQCEKYLVLTASNLAERRGKGQQADTASK